jgi:hypothetical protein
MNIPNIPDNLHKALFVIGLILVGFAYYKYDQNIIAIENEAKHVNKLSEDEYFQKMKVVNLESEFQILCWIEAKKLNIENFCEKDKDGDLQFYQIIGGSNEVLRVSDSLSIIWHNIENEREASDNLTDKFEFATDDLKDFVELTYEANDFNRALGLLGGLLAFIGLSRWWKIQNIQDKIVEAELPASPKFKHCQSCGRNFSFRVKHGTNKDSSLSDLFCSDCYQQSEFTSFLDEDSFKILKENKIKNCETKREKARIKARFEKLIRWNINDYESYD